MLRGGGIEELVTSRGLWTVTNERFRAFYLRVFEWRKRCYDGICILLLKSFVELDRAHVCLDLIFHVSVSLDRVTCNLMTSHFSLDAMNLRKDIVNRVFRPRSRKRSWACHRSACKKARGAHFHDCHICLTICSWQSARTLSL